MIGESGEVCPGVYSIEILVSKNIQTEISSHLFKIQCKTVMVIKLVTNMFTDEFDAICGDI